MKTARILTVVFAFALVATACGGGGSDGGSLMPQSTTTTTSSSGELGPIGMLLATSFGEQGFTTDESDCLALGLSDLYGENGLQEMMVSDEDLDEMVIAEIALDCLSTARLLEFGMDETNGDPATTPTTTMAASLPSGYLACSDPEGDIASEFSGWTPSIPWGLGDVVSMEVAAIESEFDVFLYTSSQTPLQGGPGDTPLIVRMWLAPDDPNADVYYEAELVRFTGDDDGGTWGTLWTLDAGTDRVLATASYPYGYAGPGVFTANFPREALGEATMQDFWIEVRTEWGPDHPIGSNDEPEWMIDSACDGPQLVELESDGSSGSTNGTSGDPDDPGSSTFVPKTVDELVDPVYLVDNGMINWDTLGVPAGWYEQVWFKAADSGGDVAYFPQGVQYRDAEESSRGGVMIDVNTDVSGYDHLVAAIYGTVYEQTLAGTGWNAREAPLAIAVAYVDENGLEHVALSEDPDYEANMFWLGFSILAPDDRSSMRNGVMVNPGEPFIHQFDLMALDPRPAEVIYFAVEGGGWAPRSAESYEVVLAAGD
jgi:hypothetical protein